MEAYSMPGFYPHPRRFEIGKQSPIWQGTFFDARGADRFLSPLESQNAETLQRWVLLIHCGCCWLWLLLTQELDSDTTPSCSQSDERRRGLPWHQIYGWENPVPANMVSFPPSGSETPSQLVQGAVPSKVCYVGWYFGNIQINWGCWNCCNVGIQPFCIGKIPT